MGENFMIDCFDHLSKYQVHDFHFSVWEVNAPET